MHRLEPSMKVTFKLLGFAHKALPSPGRYNPKAITSFENLRLLVFE
jgi:hypothetical protein